MKLKATAILFITGLVVLMTSPVLAQDEALFVAPSGNVGLGLNEPTRQLHLRGSNAVFRMDRSADTAAFMIVRTTSDGTPLKNYVIGTNASGPGVGEFIVNDLGTAVSGPGNRRMTIANSGDVTFTGTVNAAAFVQASSIRYKENIKEISNALSLTQQLQGVRFDWKESGRPALGLIAEDVEDVLPEVVAHDQKSGEVLGVNYDAIVPVLLEAIKEQQIQIALQQAEIAALKGQMMHVQELKAQLMKIDALNSENPPKTVLVNN